MSATTIEVPVFLQPIAYDSASAPPLPEPRQHPPQKVQNSILSPPEPERLPPPPPQKIPLGHEDMRHPSKLIPQRPWHDPQHSNDDGPQNFSQMSQRPRFDPQNSHDMVNRPYKWRDNEQWATIPAPQFTSFDVESALPPPEPQGESSHLPQQNLPQLPPVNPNNDLDRCRADEVLHKSSIVHVGPSDANRWIPTSKSWDTQTAYVPSSDQPHAILSHPDGRSISTTDLSVNTVDTSSPGSHQTSNTSYRENENRDYRGRPDQQVDDSFYWHSGRSSSDAEEDQAQSGSPTATPGDDSVGQRSSAIIPMELQRQHQGCPIRPTSPSPKTSATYGASALGFGGPSDWEYFGDYEAEEIDDEELYSRPRRRDSKTLVEGSTELPVDLSYDSIQSPDELGMTGSDLMQSGTLSLQGTAPARSLGGRSSQENVMLNLRTSSEGDIEAEAGPPSPRGPVTPRTGSGQAASSSDGHGQQRPDLDDVIRAWSEAPHVGKVHEKEPGNETVPDGDGEPTSIAEASLASTPRERMLGVDVILKGAPSLPKLPDFMDFLNADERELQRSANISSNPSDAVSSATNRGRQMQPLSNQQKPVTNDTPPNAEIEPKREENQSSKMIQDILPPVDLVVSSRLPVSIPIEPAISKASSDMEPSQGKFTDWIMQGSTQIPRDAIHTNSDENGLDLSQTSSVKLGEQTTQNVVAVTREDIKRNSQQGKVEPPNVSRDFTSHEAVIMTSSETSQSLPRSNSSSKQSIASPEDGHPPFTPRKTSQENLDTKDGIKPIQNHSQEHVQTPNTRTSRSRSPSQDNFTDTPSQAALSPPNFDAHFPHHVSSSELEKVQDPYSDLDPWGKASLNRFAAMLREESRAESNKDKLNIFNVFSSRESRLRVILYGTDEELVIPQKVMPQKLETTRKSGKGGFVKQAVERANSIGLERSLKALPALPANRESVVGLSGNALAPLVIQHASKKGVVDLKVRDSRADSKSEEESELARRPSRDNSPSDESPSNPGDTIAVAPLPKSCRGVDVDASQGAKSASQHDSATPSNTSERARHAGPPSSGEPTAAGLESIEDRTKPAYTPQKYNEGRSEVKNYLANRKSVCRPYATLTQESLENASSFGREEDGRLRGAANVVTAPTSQYNSSSQVRVDGSSVGSASINKQKAPDIEGPTDMRRFVRADFDPLLLALPNSEAVVHESARILDLKSFMEAVPDDFSFIHQSVVAWDANAKKQREENDRQRHARQMESEQKIDSLFDDHEIGYGDIGELEIEFKRSEAARRADEDRSEYQTFVSDVFNPVWTRLHFELDQLIPHYDQYSKLMDHTLAGKEMFEGSKEGLALGPTMSSFLALHQKLEIRHQKAFEAVLERDRRLKKTEISPWYTLSNIAKVKQLEKQFEDAEKNAIIEYCQQRDARANHLMDVLDQNTLRGVGANQDYMEAIMKAVRRIASGRAFASVPGMNEPTAGLEEVEKAKEIAALLALSSEQIVQIFHVADMLLNSADYEVSVAKAKVAKADLATLAKLKEERAKEDQKLMRDLEHRLALIREASRRTNDEIVKLMLFLGVQNGRAVGAPTLAESADPKREVRMQKALEDAKGRNALTESG